MNILWILWVTISAPKPFDHKGCSTAENFFVSTSHYLIHFADEVVFKYKCSDKSMEM